MDCRRHDLSSRNRCHRSGCDRRRRHRDRAGRAPSRQDAHRRALPHPHRQLLYNMRVDDGAIVGPYTQRCRFSRIGPGAHVGPFARLRPGSDIRAHAHIGNFVEVKKSVVHEGAKATHLSYLGDATIGRWRQYRRRHHHLQLRRRRETRNENRQGSLHRQRYGAGRARARRRRRLCRRRLGDHRKCSTPTRSRWPAAARSTSPAGPKPADARLPPQENLRSARNGAQNQNHVVAADRPFEADAGACTWSRRLLVWGC